MLQTSRLPPALVVLCLVSSSMAAGESRTITTQSDQNFDKVQLYRTVADVVLFDQRGGGRSRPALTCEGSEPLPLDQPLDPDRVAAALRKLSVACRDRWLAAGAVDAQPLEFLAPRVTESTRSGTNR